MPQTLWDVANNSHTPPIVTRGNPLTSQQAHLPVSASSIGNPYIVNAGRAVSIAIEVNNPRTVVLSNIGNLPMTISSTQRDYPLGLRLPSGDTLTIKTSSQLWAACPPIFQEIFGQGLVQPFGHVTVSFEE